MYVDNQHLTADGDDVLYHFGISRSANDLPREFGDVKFILTGGSVGRMRTMANMCSERLPGRPPVSENLSSTDRFVMFKCGPVLCVNHGMGMASMSIMFNELLKLLHYATCVDVQVFRVGTSGGLGLSPGTVVVTSAAVNEAGKAHFEYCALGKVRRCETTFDKEFVDSLVSLAPKFEFPVTSGLTMGTNDFYEAQGRLDGAFCDYSAADKFEFLTRLHAAGVRNVEMEAPAFAAFMRRACITKGAQSVCTVPHDLLAADVCVTLIDRLTGDQITSPKALLKQFEQRPAMLVVEHICTQIEG